MTPTLFKNGIPYTVSKKNLWIYNIKDGQGNTIDTINTVNYHRIKFDLWLYARLFVFKFKMAAWLLKDTQPICPCCGKEIPLMVGGAIRVKQ